VASHFDLGGEGALGEARQSTQHLASLVVVTVDGLLAHDDQLRLLFVDHYLEQFGHSQRAQLVSRLNQNATVSTQRQRGTQLLLSSSRADGYNNDLARHAFLFKAYSFFHGYFAERVHRHFDVGEINAAVVRCDANFDVVVDHSLYSDQYFHAVLLSQIRSKIAAMPWPPP